MTQNKYKTVNVIWAEGEVDGAMRTHNRGISSHSHFLPVLRVNNSNDLYAGGTMSSSFHRLSFIFIATLQSSHYEHHFIDVETKGSERLSCVLRITHRANKTLVLKF